MKRIGPLLVALAGAVLIALELLHSPDGGPSIFWMIVGGLALVAGVVGHWQSNRSSSR